MAVTITWSITQEFHGDRIERYIDTVSYQVLAEEPTGTTDSEGNEEKYQALHEDHLALDKPDTLIDYATFNKQSTLIDAVKTKLGATEVERIENMLKEDIIIQQNPLTSRPPD
tara:strand:+ start:5414 stop:5752 length:339 start_codon:yes stop_codon:yes gene_type:complete